MGVAVIARDFAKLVGALEVSDLTSYLGAKGWRRRDFPRDEVLVFSGPVDDEGEPVEVVFPASKQARDFQDRLRDVLTTLVALEERDGQSIVHEMLRPSFDRLTLRASGKQADDGALPLDVAVRLLAGAYDLLVAAAAAEERPVPYYGRATKLAAQYARDCRFGQTGLGSFVLNIECPTRSVGQQAPFARRATARLMRGLGRLRSALLSGAPERLADDYSEGLNANMCEALVALHEAAPELSLGFSAVFSTALPFLEPLPKEVVLEPRAFEYLDATARTLRGPSASGERDVEGFIVRLAATGVESIDGDDDVTEGERTATLRFVDQGRRYHALMELEPNAYRGACDAHRDGRRVRVRGTLERIGRRWRLVGVKRFEVLSKDHTVAAEVVEE